MSAPSVKLSDDAIYITDNGACYCGKHCGTTARYTGRDRSGQKVLRVTPKVYAQFVADGFIPACETCGKVVAS